MLSDKSLALGSVTHVLPIRRGGACFTPEIGKVPVTSWAAAVATAAPRMASAESWQVVGCHLRPSEYHEDH